MTAYHVYLRRLEGRPSPAEVAPMATPVDLTPGRDLSYPDARTILADFSQLFGSLHLPGHPVYLMIRPAGAPWTH